jgi:bacillithiol biosynthesis deacetylase BshB1
MIKLDILAFGAHPDDVELGCAGTLAKEISLGKKVGIIDLTRGELGTRGSATERDEEAKEAAKILGVSIRENLQLKDGFFQNDEASQRLIVEKIRQYQPDIVLCNAIKDRHIDHGKGSQLVSHACFLSGLRKIESHFQNVWQEPWRPHHVYHYIQWENISPDFVVDVSAFMDKKLAAVFAYKTQFFDPQSEAPITPIATQNFKESITYRAKDLGRLVGLDYAEGFTVERVIAIDNLSKIK